MPGGLHAIQEAAGCGEGGMTICPVTSPSPHATITFRPGGRDEPVGERHSTARPGGLPMLLRRVGGRACHVVVVSAVLSRTG